MDDDERTVKQQPTVLTKGCLHQVNKNKLTQKTDREGILLSKLLVVFCLSFVVVREYVFLLLFHF